MCHVADASQCDKPFAPGDPLYDASIRTTAGIIWGSICQDCFIQFGVGLSTGQGQKYAAGNHTRLAG
jgi:hypothetical protein